MGIRGCSCGLTSPPGCRAGLESDGCDGRRGRAASADLRGLYVDFFRSEFGDSPPSMTWVARRE
jgi:hypothetical protein